MADQQAINAEQWSDPDNWSGPGRLRQIYFSKRDSRVWVPKATPALGGTLNFGHPAALFWLLGIIIVPLLIVSIATVVCVLVLC